MSEGYFGPHRTTLGIESLLCALITATHILHSRRLVDASTHISVRNPDGAGTFLLPAHPLLSSADEIAEYKIDDCEPASGKGVEAQPAERFVHSEIYKRFPGVNSVVHSHCVDVMPYCVSGVPLRAAGVADGFLGTHVPLWDDYASNTLLVRDQHVGASLAAAFKPATSAGFIYNKLRGALPLGPHSEPSLEPDHAVVLMRGHGFTTVGVGIEEVVFQAIYTAEAAKTQMAALILRNAWFGGRLEGTVDVEHGGKIKGGKVTAQGTEGLAFLSEKEAAGTTEMITERDNLQRAWQGWVREVELNPLYRNEIAVEE